jgi:hypothetical protein
MHGKANPGRSYLRNLAVIRAKRLILPALVLCCGGSAAHKEPAVKADRSVSQPFSAPYLRERSE